MILPFHELVNVLHGYKMEVNRVFVETLILIVPQL
jgi:hypothetical protein